MIKPLKEKNRFSSGYKNGQSFYEKPAKAIICIKDSPCFQIKPGDEDIIYLGVSVSKRTAKKAVVRNRIKRLLRESVRHVAKEEDPDCLRKLQSIILIWYNAPDMPSLISLNDVLPIVQKLFDRIREYVKNN